MRQQSISAEAASDRGSGRVVEPKRSSEPAHWESPSWRGSRPFEVAVKLNRRTICASLWDVKRKCGRFQRTPAAKTITRFHAARAAIRKVSGRILNATSRVASCRGHERTLHRPSRETAPSQHVRRAVRGRRGNALHPPNGSVTRNWPVALLVSMLVPAGVAAPLRLRCAQH